MEFTAEEKLKSRRHSEKCTKGEARTFRMEVCRWLGSLGIKGYNTRCFTSYMGEVRVYNGKTIESIPLKRSLKLLAFKNPDGTIEGTPEGIEQLKEQGGLRLFERDYHPHSKPESLTLFRVDFEEDKKDEFVLEKVKNMFNGGIRQ